MGLNARRRPLVTVGAQGIDEQFLRSKIGPFNNQISGGPQAAAIRIIIAPTLSGRKWRASLDGETLCVSASPMVASARILIAKGHDPSSIVELWHQHVAAWALRGQLGEVAATLLDGETAKCLAKNGVAVSFRRAAATTLAGGAP